MVRGALLPALFTYSVRHIICQVCKLKFFTKWMGNSWSGMAMNCPACGAENPDVARFCQVCGACVVILASEKKGQEDPQETGLGG
jgi:hypothetical protein